MPTLDHDNRNRRLWFDPEMVPHCGRTAPVDRQVNRIIDETTGKMIRLNRTGMSGDSDRWEGWSHVRKYVEEVSAGAA